MAVHSLPLRLRVAVQMAYAADFLLCFFFRGLTVFETFLTQRSSFAGIFLVQKKPPVKAVKIHRFERKLQININIAL